MTLERPTVRPVTLARLVEVSDLCESVPQSTTAIESTLDITHGRARETILEAIRIGLLSERDENAAESNYSTTGIGERFVEAVRRENWSRVSTILQRHSPHYGAFISLLESVDRASPSDLLDRLDRDEYSPYTYNQTSLEVLGDWGERLGELQRNAFTGSYYLVRRNSLPPNFPFVVLAVFDDLEETAGVNLRQRYISIPELREHTCERLSMRRETFDDGLVSFVNRNIGKVELSGAPLDTGAKDAKLGIKTIAVAEDGSVVSTTHSSERIMAGVEHHDKKYYYLAVYDRDLDLTQDDD